MDKLDHQYNSEDEITLKELILKIQEFWRELWRNWWVIGLICIPFVGFFVWKTFNTPATYNAEIRFLVEGQEGGGIGGLGGLLGSFGIGNKGGSVNPYKILEVTRAKGLVSNLLFEKNENEEYLANEVIRIYDFHENWKESEFGLNGFLFSRDSIALFNATERRALLEVIGKTIGNREKSNEPLLLVNFNEDTGVFTLKSSTKAEDLSIQCVEGAYKRLKVFFEEDMLNEKLDTRDLLKEKSDSIRFLIDSKTIALARFEDTNRGLISKEPLYRKNKILTEIQGLSVAYEETLKNYEISDFNYKTSKPLFIKIDEPLRPLKAKGQSLVRNLILGFFLGCFLGGAFVLVRSFYNNTMNESS